MATYVYYMKHVQKVIVLCSGVSGLIKSPMKHKKKENPGIIIFPPYIVQTEV